MLSQKQRERPSWDGMICCLFPAASKPVKLQNVSAIAPMRWLLDEVNQRIDFTYWFGIKHSLDEPCMTISTVSEIQPDVLDMDWYLPVQVELVSYAMPSIITDVLHDGEGCFVVCLKQHDNLADISCCSCTGFLIRKDEFLFRLSRPSPDRV